MTHGDCKGLGEMANLDPLHHFLDPLLDSIVFFLLRSIFINFYVLWPVFIKHGKEAGEEEVWRR